MVLIKEVVLDLTNFVLSNVNDAISFKPQLCYQVPAQDYVELRERYIAFTGTSMRKNKSKLYFLPTNISDELQQLNPSIPESAKRVPRDGHVYYKNRLITELDFENVKRVELACAYIAYAAVNKATGVEVDDVVAESGDYDADSGSLADPDPSSAGAGTGAGASGTDDSDKLSPAESTLLALRRGGVIGFRELGYLVSITPWHFHRVFKVITGLTIREYGQLCTEFVKKNRDIMNACKKKVEELKSQGHSFHCFDEPDFLKDGSLCYEPTMNVVLLPEYFIDPNKSKEHKKKQKESKSSDGKCSQRVEARKRRSSVMSGRIRRASQTSIASNSSIQDPLQSEVSYPSTPQLSPSEQAAAHHSGKSLSASPVVGFNLGGTMDAPVMGTRPLNPQYLAKSRKGSLVNSATGVLSSASALGKVLKPRSSGGAVSGGSNYIRKISDPSLALAARGLQSLPLEANGDEADAGITTVTSATDLNLQPVLSPQIDFKFDIFGTVGSREDPTGSGSCVASGSASGTSLSVAETGSAQTPSNPNGESRTASSLTTGSSNGSLNMGFADEIAPNALAPAEQNEYSIGMPVGSSSTAATSVQGFASRANESLPRGSVHTLLDDITGLEPEENMLLDLNAMHDEDLSAQSYDLLGPKTETGIYSSNSFTSLPIYAASSLHQDHQGQHDLQVLQQGQTGQQQQFSAQEISALSGGEIPYSRNRLNSVAPEMDDLDRMFLSGYEGSTPGLTSALAAQFSTGDVDTLGMNAHMSSEQSTRDNTMATTATAATADTTDSTRAFEDKNTLESYTHLGFDTLSPCASPTRRIDQSSFETMVSSSGNEEIVGNQFHFVQ